MNRRKFIRTAGLGTAYLMTAGGILIPSTAQASQEEAQKAIAFTPSYSEVFDLEVRNMLGNPTGEKIPVQVSSGIDNKAMYISLKPLDPEQKVMVNKFTKLDLVTPTSMHLQSARLFQNLRAFGILGEPQWYELASQPYPIALSEMLLMMGKSELDVPRLSSWESRLRQYKEQRELWGAQDLEFIIEGTMEKCGNNTAYERFLFGEIRELDEKMNLTLGNSVQEVIKVNYLGEIGDAPAYALIKASFTPPHKSSQAELVELIPIGTAEILEKNSSAIKALDIQLSSSTPPEGADRVRKMKMRIVGEFKELGNLNVYDIMNCDPQSGKILAFCGEYDYRASPFIINLKSGAVQRFDYEVPPPGTYSHHDTAYMLLPGGQSLLMTLAGMGGEFFEVDINTRNKKPIGRKIIGLRGIYETDPRDLEFKDIEVFFKGHKIIDQEFWLDQFSLSPEDVEFREKDIYFKKTEWSLEKIHLTGTLIQSPDGNKILYGGPKFHLYNAETKQTHSFGEITTGRTAFGHPKWSFDSSMFTYFRLQESSGEEWFSFFVADIEGNKGLLSRMSAQEFIDSARKNPVMIGCPLILSDSEAAGKSYLIQKNGEVRFPLVKYQITYE
ncbi:MAG: hypothetical protein ABIH72_04430 [archaeon]